MIEKNKIFRSQGYDLLINTFESLFKDYIKNEVLINNHGDNWKEYVPMSIFEYLQNTKEIKKDEITNISVFFDEINFIHCKDIVVYKKNFQNAATFLGETGKTRFVEIMTDLNEIRKKIAHAKTSFCEIDLENTIDGIKIISQGESINSKEMLDYIKREGFRNANDIPQSFFLEYACQNNLPVEEYNLDGGFVGREKEIKALKSLIKSAQDRIVTITGAGGVGKSAIALKIAHSFLADDDNFFDAIIWFSAKDTKLEEQGIIPISPGIRSDEQLICDIMEILDSSALKNFKSAAVPLSAIKTHLQNIFSSNKCLLIIDNLETILKNSELIDFIKEIPRPSQVLITSRKGLGEIERRYPIGDMDVNDAIRLFRIVAKEKNRLDLVKFETETIKRLVIKVKCYPLLIKWSIGQVCLGKNIEDAFSEILDGQSEIAKFSFNDVFSLISENSKLILYSIIVYGEKPVSKFFLMHLSNLDEDAFEDSIKELLLTSFIYTENKECADRKDVITEYSMLTLTRGFVESKLDEVKKIKEMLITRQYHLSEQIQEIEKSKSSYYQAIFTLGIKTPEEQVAFNYIKAAKNYIIQNDLQAAEENYLRAYKIAPNFSYLLTEYSKFEFIRGHISKSLSLGKKAIDVNPDSYHTWFNYGISLKKNNNLEEAKKCLKKAKDLNPNHLPIFNELGRVYTFLGNYEDADTEFKNALVEEKHPNYRHKIITYQFSADNYKRWAESFGLRRDTDGQKNMLEKALSEIKKAIEIKGNDQKILNLYRSICKELGVHYFRCKLISEGRPYLEESMKTIKVGTQSFYPEPETVAESCYYFAHFLMNDVEKENNRNLIRKYIKNGVMYCSPGSKWRSKLLDIETTLDGKAGSKERFFGKIKFFNFSKKYGVIEYKNGETIIFFLSGFRNTIKMDEMGNINGMTVSFNIQKSRSAKNKHIAVDIEKDGE